MRPTCGAVFHVYGDPILSGVHWSVQDSRYSVYADISGKFVTSAHGLWISLRKAMPFRLLIVDDHEVVRLGVRTLFADNNSYEVCGEAQNGEDAILMVSELSPDVVILDLSMPGINGFETAEQILTIAPSVRIVFFSAHEIPATARLVGADAFVSKSSSMEELTLTVDRVLQSGKNSRPRQKTLSATNSSNR
jgi:DNA-binding NarL/FixJ family response regulator